MVSKGLETSGEYNLYELSYDYSFIFIIKFLYNAPSDWLIALSHESTDDGKLNFKFLLRHFDKFDPN